MQKNILTNRINILHLSDTHGLHRQLPQLPDADVIVHSGDFTMAGTKQEEIHFNNGVCVLPYRHKIFIAGNHDDCLYGAELSGLDDNCHYLCNSGINIEDIKFYGVPMFIDDDMTGKYKEYLSVIPNDTDVLITHQPPLCVLDYDGHRHYGSPELFEKIQIVRPKLHLFGHIHATFGTSLSNGTIFSNAALVDEQYYFVQERITVLPILKL